MPKISIVTSCLNEEGNVVELYHRIRAQFEGRIGYEFEHIFLDNGSTDNTVKEIKILAAADTRVKLIVNTRNFGPIRSILHGLYQASGDAVIAMASDLQDPPELISEFISHWEAGYLISIGVKPTSRETWTMTLIRKTYYRLLARISEVPLIHDFTGFGLYDKSVIDLIRRMNDPNPYFRGLIAELGIAYARVPFEQPRRIRGITQHNFYMLYDIAMLGLTSYSKLPLRLATMTGFLLSGLSLLISLFYLALKLLFWQYFALGTAPVLIGVFFFAAVQLFFIGLLGEYVATIHTQVVHRPLVIERERVNLPLSPSLPQHSNNYINPDLISKVPK